MKPDVERVPMQGTKMREIYDLIVGEGWHVERAARWVACAVATGERVVEKYINHNRMVRAERRVKELEAELAALKRRIAQ